MNLPGWIERRRAQQKRAATGYTSIRITHATRARLRELARCYPMADGADELLWYLLGAELHASTIVDVCTDRAGAPPATGEQANGSEQGAGDDHGSAP